MAMPEAATTSHVPGVQGRSPDPFGVDADEGASRTQAAVGSGGNTSPGDLHGTSATAGLAAEGTSETSTPVDGVRIVTVAAVP